MSVLYSDAPVCLCRHSFIVSDEHYRIPAAMKRMKYLHEDIWNEDAIGVDNTVAVHIRHIREKIEINPKEPRYLKVVWGVGYKIEKS